MDEVCGICQMRFKNAVNDDFIVSFSRKTLCLAFSVLKKIITLTFDKFDIIRRTFSYLKALCLGYQTIVYVCM